MLMFLGRLCGWAGELGFQVGVAAGVFVGEEGDYGHHRLGNVDVAMLPAADGAAVDVEEAG
jgi:hypothetical protein